MNDEPAFPIHGGLHENQFNGMGLRDYFAAKAMQAFAGMSEGCTSNPNQYNLLSADAYLWADAMMKAREA